MPQIHLQGILQSRTLCLSLSLRLGSSLRHKFLSSTFGKYQTYYAISMQTVRGQFCADTEKVKEGGMGSGEGRRNICCSCALYWYDMLKYQHTLAGSIVIHFPWQQRNQGHMWLTYPSPSPSHPSPPLRSPSWGKWDTMEILSSV